MAQKILIDCDPGQDDAVALMLALASPEVQVLGVTTSFGNVGIDRTTNNALRILELVGSSVPVFVGVDRPLLRQRIDAANYHGVTGMDGSGLPEPSRRAQATHAVNFLIDTVLASPGEVTLVLMAPLTNLALAMRLAPQIIPACKRVVLMGGSTDNGNDSPAAEFNILADPHAARMVFESGIPITMIGLNVTHQLIASADHIGRFRGLGNRAGEVTANLLDYFKGVYVSRYGWDGPALHDPCTIAYLLEPSLFQMKPYYVHVETHEGMNFGRTTTDIWRISGQKDNADVAVGIDVEGVFSLLFQRIGSL